MSLIPHSTRGQSLSGLHSKYALHPAIFVLSLVKVVSAILCLCKGNFYSKLKNTLLNDILKLCECSVSLAFHPMIWTSIIEPYLNQLLRWWLQNDNFSHFLISCIFILYCSVKNFSSCPLFEHWCGFMDYFLIQWAIIHFCHLSFLYSNFPKLAISGKLSFDMSSLVLQDTLVFWHSRIGIDGNIEI